MKYTLEIYNGRGGNEYVIEAPNDDAFRRIALNKYGSQIRTALSNLWGNMVSKAGDRYMYGCFYYHYKKWFWSKSGGSFDFEIDPKTGGKMVRNPKIYPGYEVSYTTKDGKKVKKHLKYEDIAFTRFALMSYDSYKDAKKSFSISKNGKKMGTLLLASNGKWVWTNSNGGKYYITRENGQVSSQIRR